MLYQSSSDSSICMASSSSDIDASLPSSSSRDRFPSGLFGAVSDVVGLRDGAGLDGRPLEAADGLLKMDCWREVGLCSAATSAAGLGTLKVPSSRASVLDLLFAYAILYTSHRVNNAGVFLCAGEEHTISWPKNSKPCNSRIARAAVATSL